MSALDPPAPPTVRDIPFSVEMQALESKVAVTLAEAHHPDQPLILVNPAYCRLIGFAEHELLGRNRQFWWGDTHDTGPFEMDWTIRKKGRQAIRAAISGKGEHFQKLTFAYALDEAKKQPAFLLATHFQLPIWRSNIDHASEFRKRSRALADQSLQLRIATMEIISQSLVQALRIGMAGDY